MKENNEITEKGKFIKTQENVHYMTLIGKLRKYIHIYKHHTQNEEMHRSVNLFLGSFVFLIHFSVFSKFRTTSMFCFDKKRKR